MLLNNAVEKIGLLICKINVFFSNLFAKFLSENKLFSAKFCLTLLIFLISFIIISLLLVRTIYKVGFYGKMNFNNYYDFINYYKEDGIINKEIPKWNKYCNVENVSIIDTESFKDIKVKERLEKVNEFIEETMFKNYKCLTLPNISDYLAIYEDNIDVISAIFSSRATMKIKASKANKANMFDIIPIHDLIHNHISTIIERKSTKYFHENLATLYYYQNSNTPNVFAALFKFPKIWNVKPLCNLTEVFYKIDSSLDYNFAQKKALQFYSGKTENIRTIFEFLNNNMNMFDIVITTEISRLIKLVSNKIYVIIGCVLYGKNIGVLFFKKTIRHFLKEPVLELQASVFNSKTDGKIKQACFSRALIMANKITKCSYLGINSTSDNKSILNKIKINMEPEYYTNNYNYTLKSKNEIQNNKSNRKIGDFAYYLHNYRCKTINADKCLIIT